MASHADMTVSVTGHSDKAFRCIFHEDEPEETEIWVPLSVLEDPRAVDPENLSDEGTAEISIAKWFLKKNDVDYESGPRDPDER